MQLGAGTPDQAGIGGFVSISAGENRVFVFHALANVSGANAENSFQSVQLKDSILAQN
jgi:hypothetical protein